MSRNLDSQGYNFRYSEQQWLEFGRFLEFLYLRQNDLMKDLVKVVIVRTVGMDQIEHNRGVTVASLAVSLGLAEETVRRKCKELTEAEWLVRTDDGYLIGAKGDADIFAMVEENIDRLIATTGSITGP